MTKSRAEIEALEPKMLKANVNMVALGAGRLDWNYFKWEGHEDWWSSDVTDTGTDFMALDAARFGKWAHVNAVVDVFAPRYIAAHPQSAAVSWLGKRNDHWSARPSWCMATLATSSWRCWTILPLATR